MPTDQPTLKIDFVSDVVCPWCAVGLKSLEEAIGRLDGAVVIDLHFQPFELNPSMPPEGQDIVEHLTQKYRMSPEQVAANGEAIRARGEELGFTFQMNKRRRTYNTFDCHRLLHWAEEQGKALPLKHALLRAYFTDGEDVSDKDVLARLAQSVGLPGDEAKAILSSQRYVDEVRAQERHFQELGIQAVPSVIVNGRHLIQGGQPPETFERALRQIAAQPS